MPAANGLKGEKVTGKQELGPIRLATISTSNFELSLMAYRDWLGYDVREEGLVGARTAESWQAHRIAGARFATLLPASGVGGGIRLIEAPAPPEFKRGTTHGWAAVEVSVPDLDAVGEHLVDSPFQTISPPSPLGGTAAQALRAMQCVGPGGELIYFTEIMGEFPPFELPTSSGAIDGIFIMVLAAADLEETRSWFESKFDVLRASDRHVAVKVTNIFFDLDPATLHRISSIRLRDHSAIEIDQVPDSATERPVVPGYLPPGISSVSLVSELPGVESTTMLFGPGGLRVELVGAEAALSLRD